MVMDLSDDDRLINEKSDSPEDAVEVDDGSNTNKKKRGRKPKRVLKAEREKLKREQLNDLFTKLASLLELCDQNNGKASILNETIRLLKDMSSKIRTLRNENATLLSESHYVATEKDELKGENFTLEAQIKSMRSELDEKLGQSKPDLNMSPPECWDAATAPRFMEGHLPHLPPNDPSMQQPPIVGPLYVIPINPDYQAFQKPDAVSNPPVAVKKPHARYPTPADSWPLHLLSKQPETGAVEPTVL